MMSRTLLWQTETALATTAMLVQFEAPSKILPAGTIGTKERQRGRGWTEGQPRLLQTGVSLPLAAPTPTTLTNLGIGISRAKPLPGSHLTVTILIAAVAA
jgi:hypothetical protein